MLLEHATGWSDFPIYTKETVQKKFFGHFLETVRPNGLGLCMCVGHKITWPNFQSKKSDVERKIFFQSYRT